MGNYNAAVLTDAGSAMLAQIQQGHTLVLTRTATGNGIYPDKSVDTLKIRTSLLSEKQSFPILAKDVKGNKLTVSTVISNEELEHSYYINEVGIYAKVDDGAEALFSFVVSTTDNTTLLEAFNGQTPITMTQSFVITSSNAAVIEVIIPSDAYATTEDIEELEQEIFDNLYGLCTKTTSIGKNLQDQTEITENDTDNHITAVTTIVPTSSTVTTITTVVTPQGDPYYYTKTTVITKGESTTTIAESYTKTAQS